MMILFTLLLIPAGISNTNADTLSFDVSWTGDTLPESNGLFTDPSSSNGCISREILPENIYSMNTTSTEGCLHQATNWIPDPNVGFTVDAKVKLLSIVGSTNLGGMAIWVGSTQGEANLLLTPSGIKEYGSGKLYTMNTTDDFHTYRITVQGNNYTVYVDGVEKISGPTNDRNRDAMYFGDGSGGSGGNAQWMCVSYTTSGAFSPNQLPSPPTCQSLTVLTCGDGTVLDESTNQCVIDPEVISQYEQDIASLSAALEQCRAFLQQLIDTIASELGSTCVDAGYNIVANCEY